MDKKDKVVVDVSTTDRQKIESLVKRENEEFNKGGDVDAYFSLLTDTQWKNILGDVEGQDDVVNKAKAATWQKHDTVEKKAQMLGLFLRHLIAPQKTAQVMKA